MNNDIFPFFFSVLAVFPVLGGPRGSTDPIRGRFGFRPPRDSRIVSMLARLLTPWIVRRVWGLQRIDIEGNGIAKLRALGGQRVVLTPNHPYACDAAVMFELSRRLGAAFHYAAAKEVFSGRLKAWFIQRLGVYSVSRGGADREFFRMTRGLITEGKRWLVIFPEGEACGQNDVVMPFQQGVVQLAFWGMADAAEAQGQPPPVHIIPIAIKYTFLSDMAPEIQRVLSRLERRLGLKKAPDAANYDRLRKIGETVLTVAESRYGLEVTPALNTEARIQRAKDVILRQAAQRLGTPFPDGQPLHQAIHEMVRVWEKWFCEEPQSEYEQQVHRQREPEMLALYEDIRRVRNFIALHDGYVGTVPTPERFLDVLSRLELEVFGATRDRRGPRRVTIRVGAPVDLSECRQRYQKDRRAVLTEITQSVEGSVRAMVDIP